MSTPSHLEPSLQRSGSRPLPGAGRATGAGLRLLPPRTQHSAVPVLSPDQLAAVEVPPGSGPVLVPGAPGTGKSTVLVEAAVRRTLRDGLDPERMLILAPGRLAADTLRDRFTARLDRSLSTTPARTWASYAFDLIRRAKAEGLLPLPRQPKLLSGPEQDLIIKELLEGHALPGLELPWPEDLGAALQTRGFRQEVRQLFDRIIESGRTAEDLVALARQCNRPDWIPAAALYSEYRDVLDLRMPEAFDPAGIITAARQIFQDSPDFLAAERDRLQLILVDDIQEANPAVFELLADIAAGKDAIITASPDTVVQGFRGARPDLVAELPGLLAPDGTILERPLWTAHRQDPAVAEAWLSVAGRISRRSGGQSARRLEQPGPVPAPDGRASPDTGQSRRRPRGDGRGPPAAVPGPRAAVCGAADPRSPAERRPGTRGHRRDRAQRRPAQPVAAVPGRPGDPGPDPRRRIRRPGRGRGPSAARCLCGGPGPCRAHTRVSGVLADVPDRRRHRD